MKRPTEVRGPVVALKLGNSGGAKGGQKIGYEMNLPDQLQPASVADLPKQAGEVRARWAWTEATVWTDRMLTALESGVKGDKWFSLIDKVAREENLFSGWVQVASNDGAAGVDHVSIDGFAKQLAPNLKRLHETLLNGSYCPQDIRRVEIPKPGSKEIRLLGIPTVRDRVVQTALRNVIEPIFERTFADHSYGFRPNRGCKDALRRVDGLVKRGYRYVVDADLKSYFDTIPHDRLMSLLSQKISDTRVLTLVEQFLKQGVLGAMKRWQPTEGTPQGGVISPLLSNIYLDPLDHLMEEQGFEMVRYADDLVILCRTLDEAEHALEQVRKWTAENGLTLHPEKTHIADTEGEGFEFLGYLIKREHRWPRKKSLQKFKDTLRQKTKRTSGRSMYAIIADINRTLRGWFEYFKHSHHWIFGSLDSWIRMRLRSILRRRSHRRGCGRGLDHQLYPNAYFHDAGLFSLKAAWNRIVFPVAGNQ